MPALLSHLQDIAHRDLRGMATRLSLRSPGSNKKEAWVEALHYFLLAPHAIASFGPLLSLSAWHAIYRLLAAGELPASLFFAEYGPIRRPGVNRVYNPPPWQSPQSVSEELYYTGLLHAADGRAINRCRSVTIPVDLHPLLQQQATQERISASAPFPLLHDLAHCLLYLHGEAETRLLHGRWLAPSHLARLNQRLLLPAETPLPGSHKRAHRLAFLFFLAEAAGLLVAGELTAFGWAWLDEPPAQQLTLLWQAWLAAEPALAQSFDQPGAYLPSPWPQLLVKQLAAASDSFTPADLTAAILADSPAYAGFFLAWMESLSDLDRLLAETLTRSLAFFGVILPAADSDQTFSLTAVGRWLLQPTLYPPPLELTRWPPPPLAHLSPAPEPDEGWLLTVGAASPPGPLLGLAPYAAYLSLEWERPLPGHRLQLRPERLAQAAAQGRELLPLLDALGSLGISLSAQEKATLAAWHGEGRRLQVELLSLLQAADKEAMQELHSHPQARLLIHQLLSPTLALLADAPDPVAEKLAGLGFYVRSTLPSASPDTTEAAPDAASLWLMGRVYALLTGYMPLPAPPYKALDTLYAALPPAQQGALQVQAQRIEAALADLLDGRVHAPPPQPTEPDRWLPVIEAALDADTDLEMLYYTAGRNLLTRRRVHPEWVETVGGIPRLVAWCHSAGSIRTFNLERIYELQMANGEGGDIDAVDGKNL